MTIDLTFTNITNIFTLSVLITMAFYHLMIYFGRRETDGETYNIYFSLFTFCLCIYILLSWPILYHIFYKLKLLYLVKFFPTLGMLFFIGTIFGCINFIAILTDYPQDKIKKRSDLL